MGSNINEFQLVNFQVIVNEDEISTKEINEEMGIVTSETDLLFIASLTFEQ